MKDLTARFDAYWDETQEHQVLINQDMEALHADMCTVLHNEATIKMQSVVPPGSTSTAPRLSPATSTATVVIQAITREVPYTLSCSFIDIEDAVRTCLGGGGGWMISLCLCLVCFFCLFQLFFFALVCLFLHLFMCVMFRISLVFRSVSLVMFVCVYLFVSGYWGFSVLVCLGF